MKEKTKQIVDKIFKQAENGVIKIGDDVDFWTFYVNFSTNIEGKDSSHNSHLPVVHIPNYDLFIEKTSEYLEKAKDFYALDQDYFDLKDDGFVEKLFMDLMINLSNMDCYDVYSYINKRSKFLDYKPACENLRIGNILDSQIQANISKNHSNLEAPYRFKISIQNDKEKTSLPYLTFAIENDKAYVYAIQNAQDKNESSLSKKIDRYFRKLNKGVDMEDIVANVSTNAFASLVIFSAYMREQGIKEIIAPDFLPIRDTARFKERHDEDLYNMTNKFMYLFLRYNFHFDKCIADYDEMKNEMHLSLNNNSTPNDNIIFLLDDIVSNYQKDTKSEITK